jgi:hypothetical protein
MAGRSLTLAVTRMAGRTISSNTFLQHARAQMNRLSRAQADLESAKSAHYGRLAELREARARALEGLVEDSLPALTPEALARATAVTGYGRFAVDDPFEWMRTRRAELEAAVREIDADERYVRRDALTDPVAGELTLEAEATARDLEVFRQALAPYEAEPRLQELLASGYGTDDYRTPWWRLEYYSDWKWGDVYAERFGKETFAELRDTYLHIKQGHDEQLVRHEAARAAIAAVADLVARRAGAVLERERLADEALANCRQLLAEHLEHVDREDLARRAGDPNRLTLVKRLHGIEHKIDYLEEMARRQFETEAEVLGVAAAKLQRKIEKYSRPKHQRTRIPAAETDAWLKDPTPKIAHRRQRFSRDYDRVHDFDEYDSYDYTSQLLWWDLMTDGAVDGDFIPEVQAWRAEHPDAGAGHGDLTRAGTALDASERDQDWGLTDVS